METKQLEKEEYAIMLNDLRHNAADILEDAFFYYSRTKEAEHYRYLATEMIENALKYAVKAVKFLGESKRG